MEDLYLVPNDAAETFPALQDVDGFVGLVHALQRVRDEVLDGQLTSEHLFHQLGHI